MLETEPEAVSEPQIPLTAPAVEPIPIETEAEEEIKEETRVQEAAPEFLAIEEEVEATEVRAPAIGEGEAPFAEEPELLQEVSAEAEAVAVAVAEGTAVVIEGVDGRTLIVLEDDGTIIDEGPSSFPVKEEIVGEEVQQEVSSTGAVWLEIQSLGYSLVNLTARAVQLNFIKKIFTVLVLCRTS